ncbi:HXXEE domain-containing protein [Collinsella aerofaciens]|uniref:HXXEE domain-containing protein n=2 Tax=Collinsella aerofaciens TaxID=74426 RepID=UPI003D7A8BA6
MELLSRWCGRPWKAAVYAMGAASLVYLMLSWESLAEVERIAWILAVGISAHVFEENTFPGGFFYQNNIGFGSEEPTVYPQNRLTNMITNLGAETIFVVLALNAQHLGAVAVTVAVFFGIELANHTRQGVMMHKKLKAAGKRTIYGPGELTSLLILFPNAVWGVAWLLQNPFEWTQVLAGLGICVGIAVCLILIPFGINVRVKSQRFAFTDIGYYRKFVASCQSSQSESGRRF